ncbi:hypothetical protein Hanom_Chr06g00524051 [Helianthus anomalus]
MSKVHGWSLCSTKILNLIPSFPKVHGWSLWFTLCNAFSPNFFPNVRGWPLWFALCNAFSP